MDYKAGDELYIMTNPPYYYKGKVIIVEGQKIVLQDNEGWQMKFDLINTTMKLNELVNEQYENLNYGAIEL
ncbi:hypothetical protein E2R56_11615 [Rhodococcus qingshengii]|nr:hypothetical protein E2R56_11615 [Rhodococcus qingshengii]